MTTRRYARTSAEAFKGADYASALDIPRRRAVSYPLLCLVAVAAVVVILLM